MKRGAKQFLALAAMVMFAGSVYAQAEKPAMTDAQLPKTQHWFGLAAENIPAPIAKQLKLKPDQGLMVVMVLGNSPASQAELKAEDLLIEVNGKPLVSQQQLVAAANWFEETKAGPKPRTTTLTFLREGDRRTVEITPAPRPSNMLVIGGKMGSFNPSLNQDAGQQQLQTRTYALANGQTAQVHQGYRVDLNNNPTALTEKSIKSIVSQGKTIVLTQETTADGKVKHFITIDQKTHEVNAKTLNDLPAEVRPLAEEMLKQSPARATTQQVQPTTDDRLEKLERENKELKDKLDRMLKLLEERK